MTLEEVLRRYFDDLTASTFVQGGTDDALDSRDDPVFDEQWVRVDKLVTPRLPYDDVTFKETEEAVYLAVQALVGPGELPAEVMDDVNLILRAERAGVEDPWLSALLGSYASGRFPTGRLAPDSRTLNEVAGVDRSSIPP